MKIRNKLTLIFTLIVALLLIVLNLYIYILSSNYAKNNFYEQLRSRALVTATIFLERDEQSAAFIKGFEKEFLLKLPKEVIRVYNEKNDPVFIDSTDRATFDTSLVNKIRQDKEYHFEKDGRQVEGIFYDDNQGQFIFIASAVDVTGMAKLGNLRRVLIFGFLLSIIIVFFAGQFFTGLILKPVSAITEHARSITETNLHLRLNEGNRKDELAQLSITINKMLERLESAFELQKNFVANASHELRTPLTSIIGNIDVTLTRARTVEEHKVVLESILEEAEKLRSLTNGLLSIAQSNVDQSTFRKEEIRLDELLIELKHVIAVKRQGSNLEINFRNLPEDPSRLVVKGDKNLLENAMLNIIDNAVKFSEGKIVMATLFLTDDAVAISITDTGIGISANDLEHIKETFYRGNNAIQYSGVGIGLALADKIIELHKGKLEITSELNKGTTVLVSFPFS